MHPRIRRISYLRSIRRAGRRSRTQLLSFSSTALVAMDDYVYKNMVHLCFNYRECTMVLTYDLCYEDIWNIQTETETWKKFKLRECFNSLGWVHLRAWRVAESRPVPKSHLMYWHFSCAAEHYLLVNITSYCPKMINLQAQVPYLHKAARTAGTRQPAASHMLPWPQFLEEDRNKIPSD